MRDLRSKIYPERIDAIYQCLGLPNDMSHADVEALLIYAVEKKYSKTIKRDYVLADWGLLCGYSNHRKLSGGDDCSAAVTERRKKFLRESSYISIKREDCNSYEDAEKKKLVSKIVGTLGTATGRCIGEFGKSGGLAEWLYHRRNNGDFLEKAIQKYNPSSHKDYIPDEELPLLLNIRDERPTEEPLLADTEQTTDNDSINPSDEIVEYEPEAFSDDGLVSEPSPGSPEDIEELSEEQSLQDSTLFPEEDIMQYAEELYNAFVDDPEDEAPPSTTFFPADKRWKRVMIPIFCLGLVGFIWTFYSIFQEGGIKAVIGNLLHGFAFGVVIMIAMIIAILALGLLAVKALDISYARKSNAKTRRSYTVQQIKDGVLGKRIVFNSISDGSYIWGYKGNEKRFVSAAKIEGENTRWRFGFIKAEDGAEYLINVFIHNDNPNGYDAVAKHCRVKIRIPGIPSKEVQVRGIISSDNARPSEYWDSVTFYNAHTPFKLICLEPATLYNAGIGRNGYSLGQRTEGSEGALIGYDYCDGEIPGGDGYESDILLKVKVVFDNNFIIKFRGDNCGPDGWQDTVEADIWDTVYFQIGYKNSSNAKEPQENVTISIDLPESLRYIPRSARLNILPCPIFGNRRYDYDYDSLFLPDGLDIGDFNPKASATITFRAEVVDRGLFSGYNEALATARVSIGQVTNYDTVKIIIYKE